MCINTIEDVKRTNKKPIKNGQERLCIVKITPKDGSESYYDTYHFPTWVTIGGVYGTQNQMQVIERLKSKIRTIKK
jgi:hypothetical protein